MRRRTAATIMGSLGLVGVIAACSLKTYPPYAIVEVSSPGLARLGTRAIFGRQCFGVFATGEGSDVTSAQFGTRKPACFQVSGKYMGAFSYADLTDGKGNAKLTLSYGPHKLTLLALDKSDDCKGKDLGYYFPNSDTGVATTYPVGNSGDVVINANTTKLVVSPSLYSEVVDLATICGREGVGCGNAVFCDTFTGTNGTPLSSHVPDIGGSLWTVLGYPLENTLQNGRVILSPVSAQLAIYTNTSVSRDLALSSSIVLGSYGNYSSNVSLLGRYTDLDNTVEGVVERANGVCITRIVERLNAIYNVRAQGAVFACDPSAFYTMQLIMQGTQLTFNFNGISLQYSNASAALTGFGIGYRAQADAGILVSYLTADDLIAVRTTR